ncbi:hypothetical protein D9M70_452080 [compost metagenome]
MVADEQDVVAFVAEHGLEVIDDAAAAAHAIGGDDDGRAGGFGQVADDTQVGVVVVDGEQLFEAQWLAAGLDALLRFGIPVGFEVAVGLGEAAGQGRVEDDRQGGPVGGVAGFSFAWLGSGPHPWPLSRGERGAVDDVFQFVEQFLGAADAEGGDQHGAVVGQCLLDDGLQALLARAAVVVQAVAVGAFQHQGVGLPGGLRGRQQRGVAGAEVAGEDHAFPFTALGIAQVALDVGGAEDVPGALQADARLQFGGVDQRVPGAVGERHEALLDEFQVVFQLLRVAAESELEGVFEDQRQQLCRGFAAEDRPLEAGGEQVGQAADVVDVHMGQQQGLERADVEVDSRLVGFAPALGGGFRALEQAAVHQQAVLGVHVQLVAGAGDAGDGAVVLDIRVIKHAR